MKKIGKLLAAIALSTALIGQTASAATTVSTGNISTCVTYVQYVWTTVGTKEVGTMTMQLGTTSTNTFHTTMYCYPITYVSITGAGSFYGTGDLGWLLSGKNCTATFTSSSKPSSITGRADITYNN